MARDRRESGRPVREVSFSGGGDGDGSKRRRGLGALGKLAWQKSAPTSYRLPDRDHLRKGEMATLCRVTVKILTSWEAEFPEIVPVKDRSGHLLYSRAQAERVLRIKQALDDMTHDRGGQEVPLVAVRRRLSQPLPLPMPFLPAGRGEPAEEAPIIAVEAPGPGAAFVPAAGAGTGLSPEAIAVLRDGLTALIALCNEPEPAEGS